LKLRHREFNKRKQIEVIQGGDERLFLVLVAVELLKKAKGLLNLRVI